MGSVILGIAAALAWGVHDLLVRRISAGLAIAPAILTVLIVGTLFTLPVAFAFGGWDRMTQPAVICAALSGIAYVVGCFGLYLAFRIGPVKLVAPVVGAFPVLSVAWAYATGTTLGLSDALAVAAIVCGIAAVALLSDEDETQGSRTTALGWAALGAVGFAVTFAFSQAATRLGAELPVIVLARLAAILLMIALVAATRQPLSQLRPHRATLTGMGLLDALALGLVTAAGALPNPEFAAVTSSVFGVVTIVLARVFLAEPISLPQWGGVGLVFAGVAALGL
ncbi:EamA family transporter [Seohaeicola nanhaiensis]|uniref:EamA family transporter n=1 Tax=Seohaeicola nanhaiensis TaxID=1387282 RepID=A0ABV9KFS9_9RHOB